MSKPISRSDVEKWRSFELNLAAAYEHNRDVPGDVLEAEIEQALAEVRAERSKQLR